MAWARTKKSKGRKEDKHTEEEYKRINIKVHFVSFLQTSIDTHYQEMLVIKIDFRRTQNRTTRSFNLNGMII